MDGQILGMKTDTVIIVLLAIFLFAFGILAFNYYVFFSGGGDSAVSAGTGVSFTLLPNRNQQHQN